MDDSFCNSNSVCIADEDVYQYFLDNNGSIYGEKGEFDGSHGMAVYNRTEQNKEESDDSTFLNPEFTQVMKKKEVDEWIIAVGKHEGFIAGRDWIEAQKLKEDIADKYNRPHRSSNALLAGIIYCPICNKKLNVIPESNRFTNGKPRFKYACPNAIRKGSCNYIAIRGVEMDEFILEKMSSLSEDEKDY